MAKPDSMRVPWWSEAARLVLILAVVLTPVALGFALILAL